MVGGVACARLTWSCRGESDIADFFIGEDTGFEKAVHAKQLVERMLLKASRFLGFMATQIRGLLRFAFINNCDCAD